MNTLSRREFLKYLSAIPVGAVLPNWLPRSMMAPGQSPNIIIVVLDALSACNMSLYGYKRETTPYIEQFAENANVYHEHRSAGSFTTSGTASLLTGTYPWTHRAINIKGQVAPGRFGRNLFNMFQSHRRIAFTQNYMADYLLKQFQKDIDSHLPIGSFSVLEQFSIESTVRDSLTQYRAFDDLLVGGRGSLVFGTITRYLESHKVDNLSKAHDDLQHYGGDLFYSIWDVFDGLTRELVSLDTPSVSYFHLYPPHEPYLPEQSFRDLFYDGWNPPVKPMHTLWKESFAAPRTLRTQRRLYDQYLANVDAVFGLFVNNLAKLGILENSYLILTSDHGESFERGYIGHSGPYVYEPSIHIPLLISAPKQTVRRDFYMATNSVDILPTLLSISGQELPDWCEGEVLPGFGGEERDLQSRPTFTVEAKSSSAFGDLPAISIAMRQGDFKLIYYKGYNDKANPYHDGVFEMYNLENDPEELNDLVNIEITTARKMKDELLSAYEFARQANS